MANKRGKEMKFYPTRLAFAGIQRNDPKCARPMMTGVSVVMNRESEFVPVVPEYERW